MILAFYAVGMSGQCCVCLIGVFGRGQIDTVGVRVIIFVLWASGCVAGL